MPYDRDRYDRDAYDRGRFDRYERSRSERERNERDERGILQRAGDEVRSWLGDEEAQRRRERDERGYAPERFHGERGYGWDTEPPRGEGYRDYGDRYGRPYAAPVERSRYSETSSAVPVYTRGSQEFGPEGYGASRSSGFARAYSREWESQERWRMPGPYVGRGPRGYQRSDERIREDVCDRLTAHGMVDASDVDVRTQNGEITLSGFVDSREAKRAAEDCAEDVPGVREVHNHLRIRTHADEGGVGRTSVLGLTEQQTQTPATAAALERREAADAAARSRSRNP